MICKTLSCRPVHIVDRQEIAPGHPVERSSTRMTADSAMLTMPEKRMHRGPGIVSPRKLNGFPWNSPLIRDARGIVSHLASAGMAHHLHHGGSTRSDADAELIAQRRESPSVSCLELSR